MVIRKLKYVDEIQMGAYLLALYESMKENLDDETFKKIHRSLVQKIGPKFKMSLKDINSEISKITDKFSLWVLRSGGWHVPVIVFEENFTRRDENEDSVY